MKRIIVLCALVIGLAACNQKEEPPVSPVKMQEILTDLHLAEAYSMMVSDSLHIARNKDKDSLAVYYKDILAHHKLTEAEFLKGLDWYKQHPNLLDSVYAEVVTEMNMLESVTPP